MAERCPGAGDVIHNLLHNLVVQSNTAFPMPGSPLTPRAPGLMTPTSPAFPHSAWPALVGSASDGPPTSNGAPMNPLMNSLVSQTTSVALSPSPSSDSQSGSSPKTSHSNVNGHESKVDVLSPVASSGITSIHALFPGPPGGAESRAQNGGGNRGRHSHNNNNHANSTSSHSDSEDSTNSPSSAQPTRTKGRHAPSPPTGSTPTSSTPGKEETPELNTNGRLLWDFLQQLLNDAQQRYTSYIAWKDKDTGVFKIVDPAGLAKLWGIQKNHLSMNYDKMSRALRYYYRVNILRKVQGERHCYQFLRNPSELKSIKNISLLRQQMEAQAAAQRMATQQAAAAQQAAQQQAAEVAALHALNPDHGQDNEAGVSPPPSSPPRNGHAHLLHSAMSDEPHDLSMDAEEKRSRMHDRLKRRIATVGDLARLANGDQALLVKEERDRERRGGGDSPSAAGRFYSHDNY